MVFVAIGGKLKIEDVCTVKQVYTYFGSLVIHFESLISSPSSKF